VGGARPLAIDDFVKIFGYRYIRRIQYISSITDAPGRIVRSGAVFPVSVPRAAGHLHHANGADTTPVAV